MAGGIDTASLQFTPTWAVAAVCFAFISLSLFLEYLIHLLCQWLKHYRKMALFEAVEKLKSVLMLLGFMSLTLTVTQQPVSKICVPNKVAYTMLPCQKEVQIRAAKNLGTEKYFSGASAGENRSAVWVAGEVERIMAEAAAGGGMSPDSSEYCSEKGKASLISQAGMSQLNNFIFVLAVMQILYSVLTMALGKAKMRRWKAWEKETHTFDYQVANDPHRFRFTRQTTFGRRHISSCAGPPLLLWTKCFFQQFFRSVAKIDYLTLRHGFITAHLPANTSFNFQKYIERSLHDDFKVVVGISPFMWFIVVIFILVDVHGWNAYLWVSFLPLIIVLAVGTKLEVIVARLALELQNKTAVIKGAPLVQPSDDLFWFNHPNFVLTLLHFTLFMNSFELSFFIWVSLQYGIKSCYHENIAIIVIRVFLAITVQVMCSYITLPLYALVTQMGSQFKAAALEEGTAKALKQWHKDVKEKRRKQHGPDEPDGSSHSPTGNRSPTAAGSSGVQSSEEASSSYHRHGRRKPQEIDNSSHSGSSGFQSSEEASSSNHRHGRRKPREIDDSSHSASEITPATAGTVGDREPDSWLCRAPTLSEHVNFPVRFSEIVEEDAEIGARNGFAGSDGRNKEMELVEIRVEERRERRGVGGFSFGS